MAGATKRVCLTLGAVLSLLIVVLILTLVFYAFLTIPSSKEEEEYDEVAFLLARTVDAGSNLSTDALDFYSRKRSEKLIEWINLNPDSPWKARLNPSAIGIENQDQAETISHVVAQSPTVQKILEELSELIVKVIKSGLRIGFELILKLGVVKDFHQFHDDHVERLERQPKSVPANFNAAWRWPKCSSNILRVRNQGGCGSCWALSAIATIVDRVCIASRGRIMTDFSAQQMIECCPYCGFCGGTVEPLLPFVYWHKDGVCEETCYPFTIATDCGHPCKPDSFRSAEGLNNCSSTCTNPTYGKEMTKSRAKYVYKVGSLNRDDTTEPPEVPTLYELHLKRNRSTDTGAKKAKMSAEELIKREILAYGPIVMCFNVHQTFLHFFDGIYDFTRHEDEIHIYDHCVKVIGWGTYHNNMTEATERYLLAVNSWSKEWAKDGNGGAHLPTSHKQPRTFKVDLQALKHHRADFYAGVPDVGYETPPTRRSKPLRNRLTSEETEF